MKTLPSHCLKFFSSMLSSLSPRPWHWMKAELAALDSEQQPTDGGLVNVLLGG